MGVGVVIPANNRLSRVRRCIQGTTDTFARADLILRGFMGMSSKATGKTLFDDPVLQNERIHLAVV